MLKHTMISFHANNENACVDRHYDDVMESFRMRNDHIMTKIIKDKMNFINILVLEVYIARSGQLLGTLGTFDTIIWVFRVLELF